MRQVVLLAYQLPLRITLSPPPKALVPALRMRRASIGPSVGTFSARLRANLTEACSMRRSGVRSGYSSPPVGGDPSGWWGAHFLPALIPPSFFMLSAPPLFLCVFILGLLKPH